LNEPVAGPDGGKMGIEEMFPPSPRLRRTGRCVGGRCFEPVSHKDLFWDVHEAAFFVADDDVGFSVPVDISGHDLAADAAVVIDDFGGI